MPITTQQLRLLHVDDLVIMRAFLKDTYQVGIAKMMRIHPSAINLKLKKYGSIFGGDIYTMAGRHRSGLTDKGYQIFQKLTSGLTELETYQS